MSASASSKSKPYTCEECGQTLSRQDHLERHRLTAHADRETFESTCKTCGRKFSRRDVLLRHYRVSHGIHCEPRTKGRPKKIAKERASNPGVDTTTPSSSASRKGSLRTDAAQTDADLDIGVPLQPISTAVNPQWDVLLNTTVSERQSSDPMPTVSERGILQPNTLSVFEPDTNLLDALGCVQSFENNNSILFDDFDTNISLLGWMSSDHSANAYSMLQDFNLPDSPSQTLDDPFRAPLALQAAPSNPSFVDNAIDASLIAADPPAQMRNAPSSLPMIDNSTLRTPSESVDISPATPPEQEPDAVEASTGTWPYEDRTGAEQGKITFPEISADDLRKTKTLRGQSGASTPRRNVQWLNTVGKLDEGKRASIIQLLSLPLERVPWGEGTDLLQSLPGPDVLQHFTDLYFQHFHELWPVVHQATFKISDAPTILVLTMACIGACYSGLEGSIEFADTLAELGRRTTAWLGEHDPRFLRSPSYGLALLLQHLHAMGSGSRRLFQMTDASRSRLISIGRNMIYAKSEPPPSNLDSSDADILQRWLDWVNREQVKRMVWFLFEFDCLYSAFSKQNPCTKVEDLPPEFPCEQLYWDAPTAFSWAACPFQSSPCGPATMDTIRNFLASPIPSTINQLDNVGKRLLIRCFGQQLHACQEQLDSSIYGRVWQDNSGREAHRTVRAKLSKTIMSVYEFSWTDFPRRSTLRQAFRVGVAGHYCNLAAAGKIVDLITRVARRRAAEADAAISANDTSIEAKAAYKAGPTDERATILAFSEEPEAVREMMWHAAQVLYLQRCHPLNSPMEPLSVFLAGITLWASCKYFCPHQPSMRTGASIQLSQPSFCTSPRARQSIEDWIRSGGKTYLEGVGDVCHPEAPSRILHVGVDQTRRLKVWKMASNVSDIFARLLQREAQRSSPDLA